MVPIRFSWLSAGLLFAGALVFGDTPGRHPAYLHARADLRRAERIMAVPDEPNVRRDLAAAAQDQRGLHGLTRSLASVHRART